MDLETLLKEQQDSILEAWLNAVFELYPVEAWRFLKSSRDFYQNPLGHTLASGLRGLYAELLEGTDANKLAPLLDQVIRVLAVQELLPSQALNFLFYLKRIVRTQAEKQGLSPQDPELLGFDNVVDQLLRLSFDIYVKCRERIFQLKVEEQTLQTEKLIQLANSGFGALRKL